MAFSLSYGALWALVIFQSLVLVGLVKTVVSSVKRSDPGTDEPAAPELTGHPVPEFLAVDLLGNEIRSKDLMGRVTALLFVSPDCASCAVTLRDFEGLRTKMNGSIVVICVSQRERCESLSHHYAFDVPVISDPNRTLSDLFDISAPPTAVIVGPEGRIERYGHPMGAEDMERLAAGVGSSGLGGAPRGDLVLHPSGGARNGSEQS